MKAPALSIVFTALILLAVPIVGCGNTASSESSYGYKLTEEDLDSLNKCVGLTADEARGVAEERGCDYVFEDPYGTILDEVTKGEGVESAGHTSTVIRVRINDYKLFDPKVYFTLSYVDPLNSDEEPNRRIVEGCSGKTPLEALTTARSIDYKYTFIDSDGEDVTEVVERAREGSLVDKSTVDLATVQRGIFGGYSAFFEITYSDRAWLDSLVGIPARKACTEIERQNGDLYFLVEYPERLHAEKITSSDVNESFVVTKTSRSKKGLVVQVSAPGYIEMEKALSEKLSAKKATKAAEKYVKKVEDMYAVDALCAEALDEDTWLITGTCYMRDGYGDIPDSECEFSVRVNGTNSKPVASDFEYRITDAGIDYSF